MKKFVINKGLAYGLVVLLAGLSISVATEAQSVSGGIAPNPQNLLGAGPWQQVQQAMANETNGYLIYTSSGSGSSLHVLVKIPHLRNSKGFCLGGFIMYTGLTALTVVWRIANGSASDVVDTRIGPHVVVFTGFGYSFFLRNKKGGSGRIIGVCLTQPSIIP